MEAVIVVSNKDDSISQRDWAHMISLITHQFDHIDDIAIQGIWFSSPSQPIQQSVWYLELLNNYEPWLLEIVEEFREQFTKSIKLLTT